MSYGCMNCHRQRNTSDKAQQQSRNCCRNTMYSLILTLTFKWAIILAVASNASCFHSPTYTHQSKYYSKRVQDAHIVGRSSFQISNHPRKQLKLHSRRSSSLKLNGTSYIQSEPSTNNQNHKFRNFILQQQKDKLSIEKEILKLSRNGRTDDCLNLYQTIWSLHEDQSNNTQTKKSETSNNNKNQSSAYKKKNQKNQIIKPTTRLMNYAIDACARSKPKPLVEKAFEIFEYGISGGKFKDIPLCPNVYTFGALMSVCARVGDVDRCILLMNAMKENYKIKPNSVIYSTILSACERSTPPQPNLAIQLLKEATSPLNNNIDGKLNIVGYNAAISVCARAGQWKVALQILYEMEKGSCGGDNYINNMNTISQNMTRILDQDVIPPSPDEITYGTVMAACERASEWNTVLQVANLMEQRKSSLVMDGVAITSALHACQQLGLADGALMYLEKMKVLSDNNSKVENDSNDNNNNRLHIRINNNNNGKKPLLGPDSVAYRLAISACARAGLSHGKSDGARWEDGIRLLNEMESETGCPPDVVAYTAAISGCADAGKYERAFGLLKEMENKYGIQPNVVTYSAVISACAKASANAVSNNASELEIKQPLKAAIRLLRFMLENDSVANPNIVTYNSAIRACAEALDVKKAFELMDDLRQRGIKPTVVTFGSLMTACERVGDIESASKVLRDIKDLEEKGLIQSNEIIYGAAISCFRKAGQQDVTYLLLRKMIKQGLRPNTATFNTVIMSQTEGKTPQLDQAIAVYELMTGTSKTDEMYQTTKPNRQTYNILIRSLASNKKPSEAENFIYKMKADGYTPDVDLFTITVTAYERNKEPLMALSLMESMRADGYNFYEIKVLDEAFKKAVSIANVVGRGLKTTKTTPFKNSIEGGSIDKTTTGSDDYDFLE